MHGTNEKHIKFLPENLQERDKAKDLGIDEMIISEWILRKLGRKLRTAFICLSIGTGGGLL